MEYVGQEEYHIVVLLQKSLLILKNHGEGMQNLIGVMDFLGVIMQVTLFYLLKLTVYIHLVFIFCCFCCMCVCVYACVGLVIFLKQNWGVIKLSSGELEL